VSGGPLKRHLVHICEARFSFAICGFRLFFRADATRFRQGYGVVEVEF
jgi:hypothetical protein